MERIESKKMIRLTILVSLFLPVFVSNVFADVDRSGRDVSATPGLLDPVGKDAMPPPPPQIQQQQNECTLAWLWKSYLESFIALDAWLRQ